MTNLKSIFVLAAVMFFCFSTMHAQKSFWGIRSSSDLIVTEIKIAPMAISSRKYSGNKIRVPVIITVKNIGTANLRTNFDVLIQTSHSNTFADVRFSQLSVGRSVTTKAYILLNPNRMGTKVKFTVHADSERTTDDVYSGIIRESNEQNNDKSVYLKIPTFYKLGGTTKSTSTPTRVSRW